MDENGNNNMLGEVLGALINNGNGENRFGGNWMWIIFIVFMMFWGGGFGGFGNRGFLGAGTNIATQSDVAATAAWGQTQDAIRDSIENTTNTVGRLAQDVNALGQNVNQLGYNTLAQSNATNQQIARTGFDVQTAILTGNNLLQGAIMGGNNLLNSAIRETAGDTKLTICQGNSALQGIVQGTAAATQHAICENGHNTVDAIYQTSNATQRDLLGSSNNIQNAIYQTGNETQRQIQGTGNNLAMAILNTGNETQRQIQGTGYGITNAIYQTSNETQKELLTFNGDNKLAICQATNAVQNSVNANGNNIVSTVRDTGNNILQGITGLGFLTQQKGDELKFELAKSTCAITSNETANTQKVLDKLCQMEAGMQAAKIQELQTANQALMLANQVKDLQAGQIANTGFIINAIRPYPVPAYTVSSPYGTTTTTTTATGA